ncbi:glycosyltransferase [Geomonas azotofigens]|uniref:glycosyltransferase n=1 Tax=Geomonas azotofigens TaxID=2843196 RepID=UPI001C11912C|nr:glycosyltransferase [Geomonas azotofigens]MBU5613385.1 glycosyltransferase [Geomonas azotofigens]
MSDKRQVALVITYYHPPSNVTGTLRPLAFAKYLEEHGYDVQILTTDKHGRIEGEDETKILRALEPYGRLVAPFKRLLLRSTPTENRGGARVLSSGSRLARLQNYLLVPDQAVTWIPFAVRLAAQRYRKAPFDVIFSTSPPESPHLVAALLKRKFGVPWIADFRDGWLFEPLKPPECYQGLHGKLLKALEGVVVAGADRVIGVTAPIAQDFRDRYPEHAQKVAVLTNGYDHAEIDGVERRRREDGVFQITYTGALSVSRPGRTVLPFYQAVAGAVRENRAGIADHLKVTFVGEILSQEREAVVSLGLERWVEFKPSVPRPQAIQLQKDADVLLLITEPGRKGVATAKLFDYIGVRRPVLALAKGDTAGRIVGDLGIGPVVDRLEVAEIQQAVCALYDRWRAGNLDLPGAPPKEYERRYQAGVLAGMFDALLKR